MKKKELMDDIIRFLRALRDNNNRPWFMAHKDEYLRCQQQFDTLTASLIEGVASFDDTVRGLQPKDCTYRIYRDVRFSADKSPYKTHMGCYICPGGKKSGYVGYYFHIGTGGADSDGYPTAHMLAVGDYCYEPRVLQILREDIAAGEGDFDDIVRHQCSPHFWLDQTGALKRNPKGFSPDAPYPEYLRLKTFCLCYEPDDSFITSPHLAERVVELFRTTLPFTRYINRAIDFAHHE
jgi:uncharacterized protein (TIGR02453 family)